MLTPAMLRLCGEESPRHKSQPQRSQAAQTVKRYPATAFDHLLTAAGRRFFGCPLLADTLDAPVVPEPGTAAASQVDTAVLAGSSCCGAQPCWTGGALTGLATRKPKLLFEFVGSLVLRFEERRLFSVLFQFPPRIARFSDVFAPGHPP